MTAAPQGKTGRESSASTHCHGQKWPFPLRASPRPPPFPLPPECSVPLFAAAAKVFASAPPPPALLGRSGAAPARLGDGPCTEYHVCSVHQWGHISCNVICTV